MPGLRDFIDVEEGNIPLIVSVPHGGLFECDSIPQRSNGILGVDKGTIELANYLIEYVRINFKEERLGFKKPFHINSKVRRSIIDLNRKELEAFNQNSFLAKEIYKFYHNKIKEWVYYNIKKFGSSLLIDIHGFETENRPPGFRDVDVILGTNNLLTIFPTPVPKRDWGKNIRGKIIQKLLQLNISIAPGHPRRREYVLTGGYITTKYGASRIPNSRAIQIEFSDRIRITSRFLKEKVLKALADIFFDDLASLFI